jgi:tetratricopeptide (TPR) repeat protein
LDWAQADVEYRRALELDSSHPFSHYRYATFLTKVSRLDDALAQVLQEERLTPFSPAPFSLHGWILSKKRQFDQAFSLLHKALRLSPQDPSVHMMLGEVCLEKGDYVQALQEFEIALPRLDGWEKDYTMGLQGFTHAVVARKSEAHRLLQQLKERSTTEWVSPSFIALINVGLGEKDAAFDWLNQAFQNDRASLSVIKIDPLFDTIRADPRYHDLLRKMKLE